MPVIHANSHLPRDHLHATRRRPSGVTQMLRLTPRNHDGQYVVNWRIDLSEDCQLHQHEDAFGNIIHASPPRDHSTN